MKKSDPASEAVAAMPAHELDELTKRLTELEAENARLHAAVSIARSPRRRRSIPWRSVTSALLITIAAVLVPVSVVVGWARAELVDEATFVATFAPVASDPAVQAAITDAAVLAIEEQLDLAATTDALFDGLGQLGLPPAAGSALDLLRAPAVQGLHSLLHTGVESFVTSDAFAEVWSTTLRLSHRALLATVATPSPDSAVIIDAKGQVIVQLAPIIKEITAQLAANGFPFAAGIPIVDATFVVAQSDALVLVATVHSLATAFGFWIPVLTLVLLAAGIAVARKRRVATAGAGIGVAIGAGAFLIAASIGSVIAVTEATRAGIPGAAVGAVIEHVIVGMRESAGDLLLIGVLTAVVALLLGNARLRAAFAGINARLAGILGVGSWGQARWVRFIAEQRVLVNVVLVLVPALLVVLLPINWVGMLLIGLGALLLWWFVAVLRSGALVDNAREVEESAELIAEAS